MRKPQIKYRLLLAEPVGNGVIAVLISLFGLFIVMLGIPAAFFGQSTPFITTGLLVMPFSWIILAIAVIRTFMRKAS
jgi:hypothetical protein